MKLVGHCDACGIVLEELGAVVVATMGAQLPLPGFGRQCPRCMRWLRVVRVWHVQNPHPCGVRCRAAACNICRCACRGRQHGIAYGDNAHAQSRAKHNADGSTVGHVAANDGAS